MRGKIKVAKTIAKSPRQIISFLVVIVLIAGMFPISTLLNTHAAFVPTFTVRIDNSIKGDIFVTLTNSENGAETKTELVEYGAARFNNFVDNDKLYNIKITGMIGYEDYYRSNVSFSSSSVNYNTYDFTSTGVIKVSGRITDENGDAYANGGTVSYSVYKQHVAQLDNNGRFSIEVNMNTSYDLYFTPYNVNKYDTTFIGTVNSAENVNNLNAQLSLKTYSITTSAGENGSITESASVPYGSNKSITATADLGYEIKTFTVDGVKISDAVGKKEYTRDFYYITSEHTVNVTFAPRNFEVQFWFNSYGEIKDEHSNNINNGGRIIASEGDNPSFTAIANENYHISSVKIDDEDMTDGSFDNDQTEYSYTFDRIKANHNVRVTFAINTYTVNIFNNEYGNVYIGNYQKVSSKRVTHGESLEIKLVPREGYDVEELLLDGVPVDNYDLSGDGMHYSYILPNITDNHDISVTFGDIETITGEEGDFYEIITQNLISEYPMVIDGVRVFKFKNKDASITFKLNNLYNHIKINGKPYYSEATITSSILIEQIEVYKPFVRWKNIALPEKIQVIIDKEAPAIDDIPPMDWTNQDYTINGTVIDRDTREFPSSGLSRVVWSKEALTKEQALTEETNVLPITDGAFSYTFTTEHNNEKYYFYAIDNADNVSEEKTIDVKIDKTKPEITEFKFQKKSNIVSQAINFLTFGTFFNEEIEVVISAQDLGISSGLKEITLYRDGVALETKPVVGASATFNLTLENFSGNEISASVTDIAGNDSAIDGLTKPTDVQSNAFSNFVGLKTEKPTLIITPLNQPTYTDGDKQWYSDTVAFTVYAATESAGLYSVEIKVNGKSITTDINGKAVNTKFYEAQTLRELFTVNTDLNILDGENNIEAIVTNNYGNVETANVKVFIDKTNPKVIGFDITTKNDGTLSKILNFLTFGNFFNEKVKVTVIADDRFGATSGIGTITLYMGSRTVGSPKAASQVGDGTYRAEFILPESMSLNEVSLDTVLSAVATDNVGNITGKDKDNPNGVPILPDSVNEDLKSSRLVIENINPAISISYPNPDFVESGGKKWYSDDVLFKVTVKDLESGIRYVQININGVSVTADSEGKAINADFYNKETHEEVFLVSTSQVKRADDGSYLIEVVAIDNAGNSYSSKDIVYKDIDIPTITELGFIPETTDGIGKTSDFIHFLEYGFYFKAEFNVVVHVSDEKPSSGLDKISYRLISYKNGKVTGEKTGTQIIADGMAVISVPKGFKGQIAVEAFDNTGNKSQEETPRGFVSDDIAPEIDITNNTSTTYNDANGNKLYVSDMSFTVTISDYDSGIREIGYSQSAEKETFERISTLIDNTGYKVGDVLENGWKIVEMDHNLVTKVTKVFSFSSDDNDIILTFDATDRSSNKKENVQTETITIDKTVPIINVEFQSDESKNNYYYSQNRIAYITVIERNFDSSLIITEIENKFGRVPTFSFTRTSNTEHVAMIDFDEGDYVFDVTGTDLGNHAAIVNFSGGNEKLFYVDKTNPSIEENFITFSNGATSNSFNTDKTATIKITEHNFDPELVSLKIFSKSAGAEHKSEGFADVTSEILGFSRWLSEGDVHNISFTFSRDAVYRIEISPKDLAENSIEIRSTVVFEIDKTVPIVKAKNGSWVSENDIEFIDVYPFSRKDEPAPTVEFSDLNMDYIRYNLTVFIPDHTREEAVTVIKPVKVYLDEDKDKSGRIKGSIFTLPDFTKDGVYALELTAVDVAGNESLINLNTYSRMVEQDVLAYIMDSNLEAKTGVYSFQYENGEPISKRPDNFSDIKICVFAKNDSEVEVVLRDNNGDEINTNAKGTLDNSIYGFNIHNLILESRFFKENFQDDTDIELHLTVKNDGNRIDLGSMHIDNIAPACELPNEFDSWHWYFGEEERTITISNISELLDESQCKVFDNSKEVDFNYDSENDTLTFSIGKGWHNIGVSLADMAGNVNNVQEKRNIHVGFFWLWVIITMSAVLITAIAFAVVYNIRKRYREEEELAMS